MLEEINDPSVLRLLRKQLPRLKAKMFEPGEVFYRYKEEYIRIADNKTNGCAIHAHGLEITGGSANWVYGLSVKDGRIHAFNNDTVFDNQLDADQNPQA